MRAHAHVFELQAEIRLVFAMYVVLVEVDGWFGFSYFYLFVILLLLSLEVPHVYSYRFFSVTRLQTCVQQYGLVSLGLHCFLRLERALCWRSGRCLVGDAFSV